MKFLVSGVEKHYPNHLWGKLDGAPDVEVAGFECDGCSNSPDTFRGYPIWVACFVHDWNYRKGNLGGNWGGRRESDMLLRKNIRIVLKEHNAPYWMRAILPLVYWGRVRIWGASSYRNWDTGEEPLRFFDRVREAYGFFRDKR